jgi:hypothetical protein
MIGLVAARVGVISKVGPDSPDGPDSVLRKFFEDPPEWLSKQLEYCREDEQFIKLTCPTIAYEVYGTASRWEEVKPVVEQWLVEILARPTTRS